ncbi:hypothetical protein LY76DRAFT_607433 [Colletotrichum caudatum]|nr:hypothetical protein LY76DRAFT_607433 [Colletotrichum caudatum]
MSPACHVLRQANGRNGYLGIYRDVLDFVLPDTLAEVVAFTSVSYVISDLLFQRGRMAETDILSGLQRWGDCIANVDDRKAFGLFALEMWPLEHLRAVDSLKNGGGKEPKDDDKYSHHSRSSTYDHQPLMESTQLDFDVMGILNQSHEEYDFSQLLPLLGNQSARASVGSEAVKPSIINFRCFNRDSDTAIFKLRDTPMFLIVLAFSEDTGDFFYRLSGCAYAGERSKAERKLQKEVFDPMKESESGKRGVSGVVPSALTGGVAHETGYGNKTTACCIDDAKWFHTFKTASGLGKHRRKEHEKDVPKIACPYVGCDYDDIRQDLVGLHYRRSHGQGLPGVLRVRGRGQKRRRFLCPRSEDERGHRLNGPNSRCQDAARRNLVISFCCLLCGYMPVTRLDEPGKADH